MIYILHVLKNNKVVEVLAIIILSILASALLLNGINQYASFVNIVIFALIILVLMGSKIVYQYFVLPLLVITILYIPIGMLYGAPNFQNVVSLYATNFSEIKEFLFLIPVSNYLYSLIILTAFILIKYILVKSKIIFYKNKFFVMMLFIILISKMEIFEFYYDTYQSFTSVKREISMLKDLSASDTWKLSSVTPKYKNYILIIGESARKDFLNAYGYPLDNTPFLSNSKGLLVNGLNAGDTYTIGSLRLMLTFADTTKREANYSKNFIQLANKANYETYWLSNQGQFGQHDTPITAIANQSKNKKFLKLEGYNSLNLPDTNLLPYLNNVLGEKTNKPKLIVLHIMGSHPYACDRLTHKSPIYLTSDGRYKTLACYVSSIRQTDDFIKDTYDILNNKFKKEGESFSLIYFSDHGLNQHFDGGQLHIDNAGHSKRHYQIPLFKISSDDKKRSIFESEKSGLNFTKGLANWLGIQSNQFEPYDLFDGVSDKNDYGLKKIIAINDSKDDPPTLTEFYLQNKKEH